MPKRSAGVLARINNFGHNTHPAKKLRASNKENDGSLSSPRNKSDVSCLSLAQPPLVSTNGQMVMTPVPWPSIEEVEDDDREPAMDPLPFDADGPIIIEVLLSITGSGSGIDSTEDVGEYEGCNRAGEENKSDSSGDDDSSDDEDVPQRDHSWEARQPPTIEAAKDALIDINQMLKPPRLKGGGYKECKLPLLLRTRLEWVASLLHVYTDTKSKYGNGSNGSRWMASSLHCAHAQQGGTKRAINVRKWAQAFIKNRDALPLSLNGAARYCRIDDEDIAAEIATHLQSLGPYIRALDIVQYTAIPEVKK